MSLLFRSTYPDSGPVFYYYSEKTINLCSDSENEAEKQPVQPKKTTKKQKLVDKPVVLHKRPKKIKRLPDYWYY